MTMFQWLFNALTFGTGVVKLHWRRDERILPSRVTVPVPVLDQYGRIVGLNKKSMITKMPQMVYNGPYAEVLHPKLCVPHPFYKSIQKMPFFFTVYQRTVDYLKQKEDEGIFRNVNKLGWNSGRGQLSGMSSMSEDSYEKFAKSIDIENVMGVSSGDSDRMSPSVDVIEGYGKYIFPEDEAPYEVETGIQVKGKESEAIVHIGNYKTILGIQKNPYSIRPFFDVHCYYHPETFWSIGMIRLGKSIQRQYDNLANTRFQNAIQSVNQMLKVRIGSDIDPKALVWKPYGLVPVEDMDDVQPLATPDMGQTQIFREQEQFFQDTLSDMIGMYPYSMGATPTRQEHVGTIYSLQAVAESRIKLLLMTMDYQGFQPFFRHMMTLNQFHLPDGFEARISGRKGDEFTQLFSDDLHPYYDFTARYTAVEPALAKEFRAERLIQLANMWQQNPALQQYEWTKAILELMDIYEADKLLKTPQQMAMEQQQMMMQQVGFRMEEAKIQDELSARQTQRELQRDVVKGLLD